MKTIILYFLVLIFISTHLSLFGQNNPNELVIINESNTIDISGQKASSITFSITKKMKFKVLNSVGIAQISKFTLPETFDQSYISHFPKDRNYTNVFSSMTCNYFKGTITTKDGEKKDIEIKETIDQVKMVMVEDNRYGNYEKFNYQIENLNIGDEVTIEYNYNVMYKGNFAELSSFRIFFNNNIFKENYQLTIRHHPKLDISINYENNATPDSIINLNSKKVYFWSKSKLSGCINEEGGRPHLTLPHVIFSIKPSNLLYPLPNSFDKEYIPFYSIFSYRREKNHSSINRSVSQGVRTKQYLQIDKFIKAQTQDITNDSLGYLKLVKIKNTIADEFTFKNDTDYFKEIDIYDPRMGDYISKKIIRDISRYDIYVALILKLDLQYFTAYICDKRTGVINNDYFAPMYHSDYLFAVLLKDNRIQYLYPKKEQFGYYLNEIPFYFENTKARIVHQSDYVDSRKPITESLNQILMPQGSVKEYKRVALNYLNDDLNYKKPINDILRQILVPNSTIKENTRRSNILANINLDTLSIIFNARINLSGQYSTLTRGLYQYDSKDETINNLYNKKIWELNEQVKVISHKTKVTNKEFPFPAVVNAQYQFNNLIKKDSDTFSLNLNNWFNHIIYNDFDTTNRQLDFHADFLGKDSYVYYLKFDKNIKLISSFESINIKNEFGELIINVEQVKPNEVKISTYFLIANSLITVDKMKTVKEIYNKIQKMNNSCLLFKLE